jgi:hypothetical protein
MELSHSGEAASCAPTQALPNILWNPKAYYSVHQINPIYTTPFYLSKLTPWSESACELYRQSDRRLSAKLVPTFADRGGVA